MRRYNCLTRRISALRLNSFLLCDSGLALYCLYVDGVYRVPTEPGEHCWRARLRRRVSKIQKTKKKQREETQLFSQNPHNAQQLTHRQTGRETCTHGAAHSIVYYPDPGPCVYCMCRTADIVAESIRNFAAWAMVPSVIVKLLSDLRPLANANQSRRAKNHKTYISAWFASRRSGYYGLLVWQNVDFRPARVWTIYANQVAEYTVSHPSGLCFDCLVIRSCGSNVTHTRTHRQTHGNFLLLSALFNFLVFLFGCRWCWSGSVFIVFCVFSESHRD